MGAANSNPENVGRIVPEEVPPPFVSVLERKLQGIFFSIESTLNNYVMVELYYIYYRTENVGKCNEIERC